MTKEIKKQFSGQIHTCHLYAILDVIEFISQIYSIRNIL